MIDVIVIADGIAIMKMMIQMLFMERICER